MRCVYLPVNIFVSFGYTVRSGIVGSYGLLFPVLWGISIPFSTVTVPVYIPANSVHGIASFLPTNILSICVLFDDSHSNRCDFNFFGFFRFCFSDDSVIWASFMYIQPPECLLWKNVYACLLPIWKNFWSWVVWADSVFGMLTPYCSQHLHMHYPFSRLSFSFANGLLCCAAFTFN